MILVRKVELSVWVSPPDGFAQDELPAEALWSCNDLKALSNELSFWRFDPSDESWRENAMLAIAGGWKTPNDGLHLAWIDEGSLIAEGIALENSPGNTVVRDLRDRHVDAVKLDIGRLAVIGRHLARGVRLCSQFHAATKREVIGALANAVQAKRVNLANMPTKLREAVHAEIDERALSTR